MVTVHQSSDTTSSTDDPMRLDKLLSLKDELEKLPESQEDSLASGLYIVQGVRKNVKATTDDILNEEWFHTPALPKSVIDRVTSVQLFTESCDPKLKDGDKGHQYWTWFELGVLRKEIAQPGPKSVGHDELGNGGSPPQQKDSKGLVSWMSHMNELCDESIWREGPRFERAHELLSSLKDQDSISVRVCARFDGTENVVTQGYLVVGISEKPSAYLDLELPKKDGDPKPLILACAQRSYERIMVPTAESPGVFLRLQVRGGVDLMGRLLRDSGGRWDVGRHVLSDACEEVQGSTGIISPNIVQVFKLGKVTGKEKNSKALSAIKQYPVKHDVMPKGPLDDQKDSVSGEKTPRIIVLDDAGIDKSSPAKLPEYDSADVLLIYQMSVPLFTGTLWEAVAEKFKLRADREQNQADLRARVVVVLDAEDLRRIGMILCSQLLWEKTMEDFCENILKHLDPSTTQGIHILVRCGYEAVFHLVYHGEKRNLALHLIPDKTEGDLLKRHGGLIPGINSAFISGLAASLARQSRRSLARLHSSHFADAIKLALEWSHRFAAVGFRKDSDGTINYPSSRDVRATITPALSMLRVDDIVMGNGGPWSIFNILQPLAPLVAARIVKESPAMLYSLVPTTCFGKLVTADRVEIKGLRSTAAVIDEYLRGSASKPLSIGVFGQPGSGKSFGVKEVIAKVMEDHGMKKTTPHEVNLSQFGAYSELVTVFHDIQSLALGGETPVVIFDEFDSAFWETSFGWLKYLLAPMQDAKFLDSGHIRPLGRAIFVFIGGTSPSFSDFIKDVAEPDSRKAKKPDFISRLSAYMDIQGPSKIDPNDNMFSIRRAVLLRSLLERRFKVSGTDKIDVDENLLAALLQQDAFQHGARSLDQIVSISRLSDNQNFVPSALPSDNQLGMHVNVEEFKNAIRDPKPLENEKDLEAAKTFLRQGNNRLLIEDLTRYRRKYGTKMTKEAAPNQADGKPVDAVNEAKEEERWRTTLAEELAQVAGIILRRSVTEMEAQAISNIKAASARIKAAKAQ